MIGLARGTVKLVKYDNRWENLYKEEETLLYSILKDYCIGIEHIGSTSIKGLASKPIIDIALGVNNLDVVSLLIRKLKDIGYQYRGNAGVNDRELFVKGNEENRTHYLHIVVFDGLVWKNHILFRDYLRQNSSYVKEYSTIKKELALKFSNNRSEYTKGKNEFISKILEMASSQNS